MSKQEFAEALKELMEQYCIKRTAWVEQNGTDEGFDVWFTEQVER